MKEKEPVGDFELELEVPIEEHEFDPETGKIRKPTAINKIREYITTHPKSLVVMEKIGVDAEERKVHARFYATVGAVIIAVGTAVEIRRKGEDLKNLIKHFKASKKVG